MKIRTIGEESPVDGWATIDYFHVLCHRGEPLFAPENASDEFWRNVVTNLSVHDSRIGQYYEDRLKKHVHIPFPAPPPTTAEAPAPAANISHWQSAGSWVWPENYEEGGSAASSSQWQGDRYGSGQNRGRQWQEQDWWSRPRYDPYHMYQ